MESLGKTHNTNPSTPPRDEPDDEDREILERKVEQLCGKGSLEKLLTQRMLKIHKDLLSGEDDEQPTREEGQVVTTDEQSKVRVGKEPGELPTNEGTKPATKPDMEKVDEEAKSMKKSYAETLKTSSWVEMMGRGAVGKENLRYIPPTIVNGKSVVHVKSSQFAHVHKKYEELVVGYFIGRRPGYGYMKDVVGKTWRLQHKFTMQTYELNGGEHADYPNTPSFSKVKQHEHYMRTIFHSG